MVVFILIYLNGSVILVTIDAHQKHNKRKRMIGLPSVRVGSDVAGGKFFVLPAETDAGRTLRHRFSQAAAMILRRTQFLKNMSAHFLDVSVN
jgi:hypothetical protein